MGPPWQADWVEAARIRRRATLGKAHTTAPETIPYNAATRAQTMPYETLAAARVGAPE